MDIEFHYYMTYLIAAKAGFEPENALTIAHASQFVDDNDVIFEVNKGEDSAFRNYISQTMNILKPKSKLLRIYPIFHFIPGDPTCPHAGRKDGTMHWLNTTPDSENAKRIFDTALATRNLYRIGIALHAYADTWAHQNFIGYYSDFNSMSSPLAKATPNIGHADAQHDPDWPALVWRDKRLLDERRDNRVIFLEAAAKIFEKLVRYNNPDIEASELQRLQNELKSDLDELIGDSDPSNDFKQERIKRYIKKAATAEYGDMQIPSFDPDLWFEAAVNERVRGLRDRGDTMFHRIDPIKDKYTWRDPLNYTESDWYQFQIAVRAHQGEAREMLTQTNLKNLELPEF
ncbi:MAG: hypothetical protein JW915_10520 [Chitinispirillaceae bacterium]|nr:hypothetical protein [Chitinispirillaceae bacterium]